MALSIPSLPILLGICWAFLSTLNTYSTWLRGSPGVGGQRRVIRMSAEGTFAYSYFEEVVRAHDNPERCCGWFLVHCSSKKFDRMAREAVDICLRMLKESNKSRFDSYSVRNSELIVSHTVLPFGIVACTFFPTTVLEVATYVFGKCGERTQ